MSTFGLPARDLSSVVMLTTLLLLAAVSGLARAAERSGDDAVLYKVFPEQRVRMRDGVELAVLIIRPVGPGKFPAVVSYYPYRVVTAFKKALSEPTRDADVKHLEPVEFLAQHGYVSVIYDSRGTGDSGGSSPDQYSDAERGDGYEMIEWTAAQSWSNGNVGMLGLSSGGVSTWQVAALAPPHLKAIIVSEGTEDVYSDWAYPGGMPRPVVFGNFAASMTASNFAPPDPDSTGEKWADIWEEHLKNNVPWSIAFLKHQTDDAFWRSRSLRPDYGQIKCPVFVLAGWLGWYSSAELRAFTNLKVPKRALIGPGGHSWPEDALPGPRVDLRPEYIKWLDQFLGGVDTGVLSKVPVTIFVNQYQAPAPMYTEQRGFWRQENEWPLARTHYTSFYLGQQGTLARQAGENEPPDHDSYTYRPSASAMSGVLASPWSMPLDQRPDELYALTYTSAPLEADLEVTGNPSVDLFVSSSADVAYFHVRVCDVAPDGTSKLITGGGLNATHRASASRPEPLRSGEVYELKFALNSIAYVFPSGHRIRVDLSSADFQNAWPASKSAVNALVRGAHFPSRVILPVAPTQVSLLPKPDLLPSPNALPAVLEKPKHSRKIARDLVNRTTTISDGDGESGMTYTVSDLNPANASIKSDAEYVAPSPEGEVRVKAHTVTDSDSTAFRHLVDVEVTVDGKRHFNKSWTVSVPRVLN